MTESTNASTARKKAKKPKGPIRHEAIVPVMIIVALVWAYFFFFFDGHLRRGLEYAGTQANGAEVDIGSLHSSFWRASLDIGTIQVTSVAEPAKNRIQLGEIKWQMLWDALLRGKIVINDASILGVAVDVPRAKPGTVVPLPKDGSVTQKALDRVKNELSKNVFGDVASLLNGADPVAQLKSMPGNLKSAAKVKELQTELSTKQTEWEARVARLPQVKDVQAIDARLHAVKVDHFTTPAEVQQSLQQLDSIYRDVDAKVKDVDATKQAFTSDAANFQKQVDSLQLMVQEDTKDLESRIKLPSIDAASLSRAIFGPSLLDKVSRAQFYVAKAREYAPPKKTPQEKAQFLPPTPHEREAGRNYSFGRPNAYPLFWLRKAQITSKATPGAGWSGNLSGTLQDVSDDQSTTGKPMVAIFAGDFPAQNVFGVNGRITMDHVAEQAKESVAIQVGAYPVADRLLINSADTKLGIGQSTGQTSFSAEFSGDELKIVSENTFQKGTAKTGSAAATPNTPRGLLYASATQPMLSSMLTSALADISKVTVNAGVTGRWTDPQFNVNSSLGGDLTKAFEKQLQAKIDQARAALQNYVDEQVGNARDKLTSQFTSVKGQLDGAIKEKQDAIAKEKDALIKAKDDVIANQKKGLQDAGKNALDKLKGRIP